MNDFQKFIHISRYARWRDDEKRRETWEETVTRFCDFFRDKYSDHFPYDLVKSAIVNMEVMPSMRALMTAGEALDRDNVAGYNCSFVAVDDPRVFDEIMYILMCGTGVGFSVERKATEQLPLIPEELYDTDTTIVVPDSRIGWASSFRELIALLYSGKIPKWNLSRVRGAGERLKTFGGRASGPAPLNRLFEFTVGLFKKAKGRRLSSLECHDLICSIADAIIVGGVRRSALISLSNLTDERIAKAKSGAWWVDNPQRAIANNSVVYTEKPDLESFLKEWSALYESKSGERGFFNRVAAKKQAKLTGRRDFSGYDYGTNPCGEIILRPMGLCNLSEVVIRPTDSLEDIARKVRVAAIIGTFQATLTDFRYLRKQWKKNAEEERLLGVSLTGIMDNMITNNPVSEELDWLKNEAIKANEEYSTKLGIQPSVSVTCIKPSGTVSQLVGCSSGIHPSFSRYYIRTVRMDNKDPLCEFMKNIGVPHEPEAHRPEHITVFSFPMEAPKGSVTTENVSAMDQLWLYRDYARFWCEHNPSITIYYSDDNYLELGAEIYKRFDDIIGLTLLPKVEHTYVQAPYQEITKEKYEELVGTFPVIDWSKFQSFEEEDSTTATQELACVSGICEI